MRKTVLIGIISLLFVLLNIVITNAKEGALYASSSTPIYTDPNGKNEIGELSLGSKVIPIKKEGQLTEVIVPGWRQKGLKEVIYAFEGKRIIVAELSPKGLKHVKVIKTVKDEDTQITWEKVELKDVWVKSRILVKNREKIWEEVSHLFHKRCSMCHALPRSTTFTANQWPATLRVMTKRAALNKKQAEEVTKFLQYHAKDTINKKSD